MRARIVLVHPELHAIHLSLKPHLAMASQDELLPRALDHSKYVPRRTGETIRADVRRIAYDELFLCSRLLDPKFVNVEAQDKEANPFLAEKGAQNVPTLAAEVYRD